MKHIRFKKRHDIKNRLKELSINQKTEDQESVQQIYKRFRYEVSASQKTNPKAEPPQVSIRKLYDSKKRIEKFYFRVKGCFYTKHKRRLVKVNFHHTLNIHIHWKSKDFSPKKSAVLTK